MRITYDPEADAMYIKLSNKPLDGATPVDDSLIVHYAQDDTIAGLELLDVSKHADDIADITAKYHIDKIEAEERAASNVR